MNPSQSLSPLPCELQDLESPVNTLYYRGDTSRLSAPKVSIVGARKAYPYTRMMTHNLALALSKRNVCVVSGGAMGVDAIAHEGAYPNTIAVLANGLDIIYPKVNRKLLEKIASDSLLLSEYRDGEEARSYTFVERNRIVVALGEVLVIAQADLDSGSMRSAEFALQTGKKIYVLPHRLGESRGTMKLLEHAKAELITDIDAFADMFGEYHQESDPFLVFCAQTPSYDEALRFDGQKLFEYELPGKTKVAEGKVYLV